MLGIAVTRFKSEIGSLCSCKANPHLKSTSLLGLVPADIIIIVFELSIFGSH